MSCSIKAIWGLQIVVMVVCAIGYVLNVVELAKCDFQAPYKAEIVRGAGTIVFPAGCVAGFLSISDGAPVLK